MKYLVTVEGQERAVELDDGVVRLDGRTVDVDVSRAGATDVISVLVDGRSHAAVARRTGRGTWRFQIQGHDLSVEVVDERTARVRALSGTAGGTARARTLKAPMPGMVVKVEVGEGDLVSEGQGLVIVEAMKMENELRASADGRVGRILVSPGDAVEKDQILMEFATEEAGDDGPAPRPAAPVSGR